MKIFEFDTWGSGGHPYEGNFVGANLMLTRREGVHKTDFYVNVICTRSLRIKTSVSYFSRA